MRRRTLALPLLVALICSFVGCASEPPPPVDASVDALSPLDASDVIEAGDSPRDAVEVSDARPVDDVVRCAIGLTFCGDACVDPRTSVAHCGACGRACAAGEECLASACVARCAEGEVRCGGGCVDSRTDRANCGACGRACPTSQVCSAGECLPDCASTLARCDRPGADGGVERYCADLRVERSNCGTCGNACAAGLACMSGRCLAVCTPAQARCGDTCHDLTSDLAHCGACGRACAGEERCLMGRCRVPCMPGFADCAETCVDLAADIAHCGSCGLRCRLPGVAAPRCLGGRCGVGTCEPGRADCNGDPADGCEVDLHTRDGSCGACGRVCAPPRALGRCVAGSCVIASCAPGHADCNGDPADGCEVDTNADDAHCGACSTTSAPRACRAGQVCAGGVCATACGPGTVACAGDCVVTARDPRHCSVCARACALPNAAAHVCVAGACNVAACRAGFADCDRVATNGCEAATGADVSNCGACGRRCVFAHAARACEAGACRMGACEAGWADCDGDASNGCEVDTRTSAAHCGGCSVAGAPRACAAGQACSAGTCATGACAAPLERCGSSCADLSTDPSNCGRCDRACRLPGVSVAVCASGSCAVSRCATGRGDCNGEASDGCEVDTGVSLDHCGACGASCRFANAAASCDGGECRMGACNAGFADCDRSAANGCEVNTALDPANCGACSASGAPRGCAAGQVCARGACRTACDGGTVLCDGLCIDVSADPANCGGCRTACGLANATASCEARVCRVRECRAGFADCDRSPTNGCEVNVNGTDRTNCGACGRVCVLPSAAGACVAGACVPGACTAGFGDCDGSPANGCEVRLAIDASNCGACGRRCAAGTVCSGGACVAMCATGVTACAASCRDTMTDTLACGSCGAPCPSGPNAYPRCLGGACGVTCASGFGNCDGVVDNGCERALDTLTDCGACARPCRLANAVSACTPSGSCVIAACVTGFGDCDGVATNGCEVNLGADPARCGACTGRACATGQLCEGGTCVAICSSGRLRCGSACLDARTDARNCNTCGVVCVDRPNARGVCAAGACALACDPGRADCNDDVDDGCETSITTESSCGACGLRCGAGRVCVEGSCRVPPGYRSVTPEEPVGFVDACAAPGATRVMFARSEGSVSAAPLPFAFPFWGSERASGSIVTLSTNGYVRLGADTAAFLSGIVPSTGAPDGVIAVHWGDLQARDPQLCLAVTGSTPSRRWIIEWPAATRFENVSGTRLRFEAILHETTGVIDMVYATMSGARRQTTGIESPDGRVGVRPAIELHSSCIDTPGDNCLPADGTAYRFVPSL